MIEKYEVRCNNCGWEGYENDLKLFTDLSDNNVSHDIQYFKGCPECETDAYLMDIEKEVKEYVVDVQRISYASHTIIVKATSIEEAKELAIEQGMNMVFTESSAEYEIGFCEEKEK